MKTVYCIRHGETEGNTGKLFQGPDTPLTARGLEQAHFIAERCRKLPIDLVVTSSMRRAVDTAAVIADKLGKDPQQSGLFAERRRPSELLKMSVSDPQANKMNNDWFESFHVSDMRVGDGENFLDVKKRSQEALQFLESLTEDNILVVTHGFFLRVLFAVVVHGPDLTPSEFHKIAQTTLTSNVGLTVFHFYPEEREIIGMLPIKGWILNVWNDHAHLG